MRLKRTPNVAGSLWCGDSFVPVADVALRSSHCTRLGLSPGSVPLIVIRILRFILLILLGVVAGVGNMRAQTLTTLHQFVSGSTTDGENPEAGLVQGSDGYFYGTTAFGGTNYGGVVFRISSTGTLTTLYQFDGVLVGREPLGELVEGSDGNFYGTTYGGGSTNCVLGCGTVFRINSAGTLVQLYQFGGGADGRGPHGGLVEASDGNFYGTTYFGGTNNLGTVFQITSSGTLTTLYQFSGGATNGRNPEAGLVQGSDGNFYGTSNGGGIKDSGTVFRVSSSGTLTTLYQFGVVSTDGTLPYEWLVQGGDGDFYGTTYLGGTNNLGTVFRISPAGTLTTLYQFGGGADGNNPNAGLVQGRDGSLYGTTFQGGTYNVGTVFRMSPPYTVNAWIGSTNGKWEIGSNNWSLGVAPSTNDTVDQIVNAGNKTVTIDGTTVLSNSINGCLTISNLIVSAPLGSTNTLSLNNAGLATPLDILNSFTISANGAVLVTNSVLRVDSLSGGAFHIDGVVTVRNNGSIIATNSSAFVGYDGVGQMTTSNGTWQARDVHVGFNAGSRGTLTVAGGTQTVSTSLTVGTPGCISTGVVTISGGSLFVTNGTGNAVLEIDSGTVTLSSGTLRVDTFIMTNACGHFTRTGGIFLYSVAVLDPNLDADGDGLPNGWEQTHGLDPLDATGANGAAGDPDGDGFSNLQEYTFGSDPNDSSSVPVNSWTNSASGKWETASNWSLGLAPTNNQTLAVTNALSKTVTVDGTTAASFPDTMTISNLTMSGAGSSTNTLSVETAGVLPFQVRDQLVLSNNSVVFVDNLSELNVDGDLSVGSSGSGNQLIVTNGGVIWDLRAAVIGGLPGSNNTVEVTDAGSWQIDGVLVVRNSGPGVAIKVAEGGSAIASTNVFIGDSASADGNIVLITDPASSWNNGGLLSIGGSSSGAQFIVTNGAQAFSQSVTIGDPVGINHSATLTGTDSYWQVMNTIQIGNGSTGDSLTISDAGSLLAGQIKVNGATLVLNGGTFSTSSLIVTNGGAVQYAQSYKVDNTTVSIASGTVEASSNLVVASTAGSTGVVNVAGGQLVVTNAPLSIGNDGTISSGGGVGLMTVSNATLLSSTNLIGSSAGGHGDLVLEDDGQIICPAGTNCLMLINSLGFGQIGGTLTWVGSTLEIGVSAAGDYSISGGQAVFDDLYAGYGDIGTMTMAGGVANVNSRLIIGHLGSPVSTGAVWITGGQLTVPNNYTLIGNSGVGQMTISNGIVTASDVIVGNSSNPGTLSLAGGTLTANTLVLPNPASRFIFSGGFLNAKGVTNVNGQVCILGDAVSGATLSLLGGITLLDSGFKVSTNATLSGLGTVNGNIANYGLIAPGGLLTINGIVTNNATIVAPPGSTINFNGTVVNNGLIVTNGAIHFNAGLVNNGQLLDAAADTDGDGMNNTSEALAGTNPTNSTSVLRIVSATAEGNNIRVTWSAVGGKRYIVQAGVGSGGNYANSFADISPTISVLGVGETAANYLDVNGGVGSSPKYYRVRLAP